MNASLLIGREAALAAVRRAFTADAAVVTLLGPPGIGKTTLATTFLGEWPSASTLVVSLVAAPSFRDVCARLAATASLAIPGHLDDREALAYVDVTLRERGYERILFDNADPVVPLLKELLRVWRDIRVQSSVESRLTLRILVTSRERLGVPDERIVELGPLSPAEGALLFERHASRWQDESTPAEARWEASTLEDIVTALDGVPLAIELAAARASMLGPREMRARLGSRFEWLRLPHEHDEGRHVALWNTIEWSWNFLDSEEKRALTTLALLATSFTVETATSLLGDSARSGFSLLEALRNKSLVSAARLLEETRFSMLESIREFARLKLAAENESERTRIQTRFASVMASRARAVLADYEERGFVALGPLLGGERENLRLALSFLPEGGHVSLPLSEAEANEWRFSMTRALACALQVEGLQAEFEHVVVTALASPSFSSPREQGILHRLHGFALFSRGRVEEALAAGARALACPGQTAPARAETEVLLAVGERQAGNLAAAEAHCRQAIAVMENRQHRALGDACANLGLILAYAGKREEARSANERALRAFEDAGDPWGQGLALGNLGELAQEDGNFGEARRLVESALQCLREVRDGRYQAVYTSILAMVEHEAGLSEPEASLRTGSDLIASALSHYRQSTEALHRVRGVHAEAAARAAFGALLCAVGQEGEAEMEFQRAERLLSAGSHLFIREALSLHRLHLAPVEARKAALAKAGTLSHGVRFACRLLARTLPKEHSPRALMLAVAKDGRHFVLGGTQVDLTRRGSLRRILAALVDAHGNGETAPRALSSRELIDLGWPGENVREDAAANRLRVAITTLRKLGLAEVLVTRDDGYVLNASVVVL